MKEKEKKQDKRNNDYPQRYGYIIHLKSPFHYHNVCWEHTTVALTVSYLNSNIRLPASKISKPP